MTTTTFLILLSGFSLVSSLITEGVKNLARDKENLSCNLIALVTALLVGSVGTAVYYQFHAIPFTGNNVTCMLLMGLASGLTAMVGFDKVKQTLEQFFGKQKG